MGNKQTEASPIPQGRIEPMAAHVHFTGDQGFPNTVMLHPEALPETGLEILRYRHAGGALENPSDEPRSASVVRPHFSGFHAGLARHSAYQLQNTVVGISSGLAMGQFCEVRLRVRIFLIPRHSRGMLYEIPQTHSIPRRFPHFR